MIYFTSDLHFFHNKEFVYAKRGFESIDDMNREIIKRFNSVLKYDDTLYILGDCGLGGPNAGPAAARLIGQINCGNKYLAIGNHDTDQRIDYYRERGIFKDIQFAYRLKFGDTSYFCSHYPTITANMGEKKPIVNLFGHTHQSNYDFDNFNPHYFHVGVDSNNCYPISIEQIQKTMNTWAST